MNISFVGGYSWGKLSFFSRDLESRSCMISTWMGNRALSCWCRGGKIRWPVGRGSEACWKNPWRRCSREHYRLSLGFRYFRNLQALFCFRPPYLSQNITTRRSPAYPYINQWPSRDRNSSKDGLASISISMHLITSWQRLLEYMVKLSYFFFLSW